MSITSMEIKFSNIGINTANQPRKIYYIPVIVLGFDSCTKKKRVYLDILLRNKKSVKEALAGETFIVILVDHEFNVFDLEGKLQGKVSSTEYGVPVQINEDSFILCKDRTVTWITNKGDVLKARELTEEEHQALYPIQTETAEQI